MNKMVDKVKRKKGKMKQKLSLSTLRTCTLFVLLIFAFINLIIQIVDSQFKDVITGSVDEKAGRNSFNIFSLSGQSLTGAATVSSSGEFKTQAGDLPQITFIHLNTTNILRNDTTQNLTANVQTVDTEGDNITVIYNWLLNSIPISTLNMPFEKINGTNTNNAKDYSGYENTGEETNGVLWNESAGYDGKGAYKFDGVNDYLFVGNRPSLNITTNDFTLTAWFKTNQNVYGSIYDILNKGALGVVGYGSLINNNNFTCSIQANGGTNQNFKANASINNNTWYFGACVYDRSDQIYKYINGELVGSAAYDSGNNNSLDTGTNFQIGARSGANLFNGTIDEIRIYNRSLSAQQILALYNNRTDLIVSQEILQGQNWSFQATPNDGANDGAMNTSNNVTILDPPPNVTGLVPTLNSEFTVGKTIEISANITDNLPFSNETFTVNLTYPNSSIQQLTISNSTGNPSKFNTSFTIPSAASGLYTIRFIANDSNNNVNSTETTNFTGLVAAVTTTATGEANITITSTTSITIRVQSIDFGSGFADGGSCVMASNGQHNQTGAFCMSFRNVTDGFYLENTGNLNLSVNYSCSGNCTAASFIGGTNPAFQLRVKGAFFRNVSSQTNDTAASCQSYNDGSSAAVFNGWNISTNPEGTYVDIGSFQNATLCGNTTHFPLDFQSGQDAGVIDVNVSIPTDAPATPVASSATFTFTAMSSG